MCIRRSVGFTLIELIVFIVIVSVGLAGVLLIFNTVTRGSADPVRAKQALAVAEGLMDEVLEKNYCDPDTESFPPPGTTAASTCGANTVESNRNLYDSTVDFDGYNPSGGGVRDVNGSSITALSTYSTSVTAPASSSAFVAGGVMIPASDYRIVTVRVTDAVTGQRYDLTAYKFNND